MGNHQCPASQREAIPRANIPTMPRGLHRYQQSGGLHFLTFSCYHRLPYLKRPEAACLFESALEAVRRRYGLAVLGYIVMPEHIHMLVNEPKRCRLDRLIQALKISVARRQPERPFWQARYYDFNVHSAERTTEKLRYIHRNPVARGLVSRPEDWPWSSYRHYASGIDGTVQIESFWTAWRREHGGELPRPVRPPVGPARNPMSPKPGDMGHP
ncbi:MAG: REP-associated tyrosine transposase, partial [Terracidiphilus sp.]